MKHLYFLFFAFIGIIFSTDIANAQFGDQKVRVTERTIEVKYLDENTYLLTKMSTDSTYGYSEKNPIKVGSLLGQHLFLNALLGKNGESIRYERAGSCCQFKTPNALFGTTGFLDGYELYIENNPKPIILYLNLYDEANLEIPIGLTAKRLNSYKM